ncbi:MAG: hypothetical protein KVP17_000717 [Porospora cf. gigantea B]|uniref:uncharacterized protein n=2 Tax=Porospora cf. gigantea B TaxID=2853592 RepID=UPI00357195DE|nr:MAG: hypothetical protein KVP17_000717 [Porospora cf. gigantea B]
MRHIFFFVNPSSGGNLASRFLTPGIRRLEMTLSQHEFNLHFFNIKDGDSGEKPGFQAIGKLIRNLGPNDQIYSIACGGDGTVMWMVQELWAHGVDDTKRLVIGVVPFGTGNDFARAMNWQSFNACNPWSQDMRVLTELMREWTRAAQIFHDVWLVEASVRSGGSFLKVDSDTKKKVDLEITKKSFLMSNYFSIGIESRIGVNFDRRRKNNQVRNKFVYFEEGFKKVLFGNTVPIDKTVQRMTNGDSVIFDNHGSKKLLPSTMSLVGINIPSFGGGMSIWEDAKPKMKAGVIGREPGHLADACQVVGDGCMEWVSFHSAVGLGSEKVVRGRGYRIDQGPGPYELEFYESLSEKQRIYFEVDGEFFVVTRPHTFRISHHKQVRTLMR